MPEPRRSIPVCRLFEKKLSGNRTHLVGRWGEARVIIAPGGTTADGSTIFTMFVTEPDVTAAAPPPAEKQFGSGVTARQRAEAAFAKRL